MERKMHENYKGLSKHMTYNSHPKQLSKGLFKTQYENYKACPIFHTLFSNEQNPHYLQSKRLTIKSTNKTRN